MRGLVPMVSGKTLENCVPRAALQVSPSLSKHLQIPDFGFSISSHITLTLKKFSFEMWVVEMMCENTVKAKVSHSEYLRISLLSRKKGSFRVGVEVNTG